MLRVDIDHALCHRARAHLDKQLCGSRHCTYRLRLIDTTLKSARGLGVQANAACCAANRRAVEGCRFENDRGRPLRDLGLKPPHDARKPCGLFAVGNDKLIPNGDTARIVQCVQVLPCTRTACREAVSCDSVVVIGMERLPQFEHDEVRHIDHVVDRTDARAMQTLHHPCGRRRNLHIAQHTRREAAAELIRLDADVHELGGTLGCRLLHCDGWKAQLLARQCRNLTRNANDAEAVRTVRRQLELEHDIIQSQCLGGGDSDGRILLHDVDAVYLLIGKPLGIDRKLPRRAHHAVRRNAAQLALGDLLAIGKHCADHSGRNNMPLPHIGGTRHNLNQFIFSNVQLTDEQMIGVRMRRDLLNACRDDLLKPLIRTHDTLDGNARHCEAVCNLLRCFVNIHIVFQPFDRNLHRPASLELM